MCGRPTSRGTAHGMTEPASLRALALVCGLKPSPAPSSSEKLAGAVLDALAEHGVTGETLRVVDHDVKPGALNDVGFTIAAQGATYWNGEAMQGEDYNDLDETPEAVATTTKTLAANTAHLARLLKGTPYSKAD